MSILRKWLGFTPFENVNDADPDVTRQREETALALERERQELRQKLQRQQSASRVFGATDGALRLMERDRGRR